MTIRRRGLRDKMDVLERVREYWDADAATYDQGSDHVARSPAERATWTAALSRHLPPAPARVLDVGAGTGFLGLAAARLGHHVTALDLSAAMLGRLAASAAREGLDVTTVQGSADTPPDGPFDAVMERHVLWTLPDPVAALAAWRLAAPQGRLVSVGGLWGAADPVQERRQRARSWVRRLRGAPSGHHRDYDAALLGALPLSAGLAPDRVVELVKQAGWHAPALERLRDVEWTRLLAMPPADRLLGVTPVYVITATAP